MKAVISDIKVDIQRKKVKRITIKVFMPNEEVKVTAPIGVSDKKIFEIISKKADWIKKTQEKIRLLKPEGKISCSNGDIVYIIGEPYCVFYFSSEEEFYESILRDKSGENKDDDKNEKYVYEKAALYDRYYINAAMKKAYKKEFGHFSSRKFSVFVYEDKLIIISKSETDNTDNKERIKAVRAFLSNILYSRIKVLFPMLEKRTGLYATDVKIRDAQTRYGSCNTKTGHIMLALSLVSKPSICLEYVILHELIHLRVPNHSKNFKAELDKYMPNWREIQMLANNTPENVFC